MPNIISPTPGKSTIGNLVVLSPLHNLMSETSKMCNNWYSKLTLRGDPNTLGPQPKTPAPPLGPFTLPKATRPNPCDLPQRPRALW
jgi:hypothetical protein